MSAGNGPVTTDQLTAEIKRTRQELGDTVQQLAAKANVKAQLDKRAEHWRGAAKQAAGRLAVDVRNPAVAAAAAGVFAVVAVVLLVRWRAAR